MSKITTDFVGNESLATTKSRLTSILEYWGYTPSLYTNWGGARTDMNSLLGSTAVTIIGATELAGTFLPKINFLNDTDAVIINALFSALEIGFIQDFSDPDTLYTDAAGAVLLTAPGQTIGLVADKSRVRSPITSYAGVQASAGLRPTYGRAPKSRRNRLLATETFVAAANMVATVVTDGTLLVPTSGFSDCRSHNNYTVNEFGLPVAISVSARADGAQYMHLGRAGGGAWFDLLTGTVLFVTAGATATIGATGGDGLRRASVVFAPETLANGTATQARIYVSVNAPTSVASTSGGGNNSVDGVVVNYLQLEQAAASTPYQKVTTAFDMTEAGVNSYGYTCLDRADDKLTVTLPSSITGDLMLFGRNGSWLEAGVTLPSGAFDLGPTGTVLTPGILSALGDLVGDVVIARTTSTEERDLAKRYFAGRGAAGWLVAGDNLWLDGGFTVNSGAAWTINGDGSYTAAGGTGSIGYTGAGGGVIVGRAYLVELEVTSRTSGTVVLPFDGGVSTQFLATTTGIKRGVWVATNASGPFVYSSAFVGTVRGISCKPLTPGV